MNTTAADYNSNGGYTTTSTWTFAPYVNLSNIERELTRIADALEKLVIATPPPKPLCAICKQPVDFYTTAPYGSAHEDEKVCSACFDKLFEVH